MKIVINKCYGGFGLSKIAEKKYLELLDKIPENFYAGNISRDDINLVKVVEEFGDKANDRFSEVKIVEIPDDTKYQIEEYDGMEWVAEEHRTWE